MKVVRVDKSLDRFPLPNHSASRISLKRGSAAASLKMVRRISCQSAGELGFILLGEGVSGEVDIYYRMTE